MFKTPQRLPYHLPVFFWTSKSIPARKKMGGVFNTKTRESLFKSPVSVDGRVGVMRSGHAMTEDSKFRPLSKGEK